MARLRFTILATGLLAIVGCNQKRMDSSPTIEKTTPVSQDDVRRDASTAMETTAAYTQQTKDKVTKDLQDQLAVIDSKIEELKLKGKDLAGDARAKWESTLADLAAKRTSANARLEELENSTADAWSDVERGAKSAWTELSNAVHDAAKEF